MRHPRGPVYVDVPADVLGHEAVTPLAPGPWFEPLPTEADLDAAAAVLADARVVIWAGGGAVDAEPSVAVLAEHLGAPVVASFGGRGVPPTAHPLTVGLPPHEPEVAELIGRADVLLAVGGDLDGMNTRNWTMPRPPRLVTLDPAPLVDPPEWAADATVAGRLGDALRGLRDRLPSRAPWAPPRPGRAGPGTDRRRPGQRRGHGARRRGRGRAHRRDRAGVRHGRRGLLGGRLRERPRPAQARVPGRLGHARLRPARRDRARRRGPPGDRGLRRRRPRHGRGRARHAGAGTPAGHRPGRRRRWLRDAALRPGPRRRPGGRRRPGRPGSLRPRRGVRAARHRGAVGRRRPGERAGQGGRLRWTTPRARAAPGSPRRAPPRRAGEKTNSHL